MNSLPGFSGVWRRVLQRIGLACPFASQISQMKKVSVGWGLFHQSQPCCEYDVGMEMCRRDEDEDEEQYEDGDEQLRENE